MFELRPIPSVYTLPLMEILDGVAEDSVAFPPEIDRLKSVASKFPEPPLVLNTASLMVTAIVELFAAKDTELMVGATVS